MRITEAARRVTFDDDLYIQEGDRVLRLGPLHPHVRMQSTEAVLESTDIIHGSNDDRKLYHQ